MAKKLQTSDTDQLIYTNDLLQLTILGGIKLEGLDRMRATLKVDLNNSAPQLPHDCIVW